MSGNNSEESTSDPDQSYSYTQQGNGLGNIIRSQSLNKFRSSQKRKRLNTFEKSESPKITDNKNQLGTGKKKRRRKRQRKLKQTKKRVQVGKGVKRKPKNSIAQIVRFATNPVLKGG